MKGTLVIKRYIIYACPTGDLANQLATYFARSNKACGPNRAHDYMPHCSLTGFFEHEAHEVDSWSGIIEDVLSTSMSNMPRPPVHITDMAFRQHIHCLELESPWLISLTSKIISAATSQRIAKNTKPKGWLHLSLAYGFREEDAPILRHLAVETICPSSAVGWELRYYSRDERSHFECLHEWSIK
jgi:hypothetical protein